MPHGALSSCAPLRNSSSTPTLPSIRSPAATPPRNIYGRQWTTTHKRLLHENRERSWLRQQGKHSMVDFSDLERAELRHYFEAIAEVEGENKQRRIRKDRLEDMLISLGLADQRKEIDDIVQAIDDSGLGELDFEQYLTIVRTRADPAILCVFKAMIDGKLGDRNLNFQTVISGYRRGMIIDATGARNFGEPEPDKKKKQELEAAKKRGTRILNNFAAMQKSRLGETEHVLPSKVPPGGLEMLWHTVCQENGLSVSREEPAAGRSCKAKRALDPPRSPREIIESIVKARPKHSGKQPPARKRTLVIGAPRGSAEDVASLSATSSQEYLAAPSSGRSEKELPGSRPSSKEGAYEVRAALPDVG